MDTVADIGLIKLDALGLKTLSVISDTLASIKERHGKDVILSELTLDDKNVYKMLSEGYTKGVFQAEATPYTNLLMKMGVDKFEDLVASNALVRPGAMNTVGAAYINRKHGREAVDYSHTIMKEFTENTYGVIIYQEQVMQACVHLGGMSWSEADKVRKIIGKKKDAKEFDQFKDQFVTGASKHIAKKKAEEAKAAEKAQREADRAGQPAPKYGPKGESLVPGTPEYDKGTFTRPTTPVKTAAEIKAEQDAATAKTKADAAAKAKADAAAKAASDKAAANKAAAEAKLAALGLTTDDLKALGLGNN
jgi:hypothetical protein